MGKTGAADSGGTGTGEIGAVPSLSDAPCDNVGARFSFAGARVR
jgi:hypothetical protein